MKKILVTGGAGFVGSNLCKRLVKDEENEVVCLDNLSEGRLANIKSLLSLKNFTFLKRDVMEPLDIEVDQIYNAACPASPKAYQLSPTTTTKTSVLGVINMLELAKKNKATLLQFSTSEVYGNPLVHPQVESYWGNVNTIGIRSCYDEGKRCAESLCFDYHREFGVPIKVIRIFNTYGPNMDIDDGRVVSNFIVQALRGEDITIYGNGSQTRSFQYVDDLIEGIYRVMNATPPEFLGPINLGNPGEFTILELAEKVIKLTGSSSRLVFEPLPQDDPIRRQADISLAKSVLQGWYPKIDLEEGLLKTIAYFEKLLKPSL